MGSRNVAAPVYFRYSLRKKGIDVIKRDVVLVGFYFWVKSTDCTQPWQLDSGGRWRTENAQRSIRQWRESVFEQLNKWLRFVALGCVGGPLSGELYFFVCPGFSLPDSISAFTGRVRGGREGRYCLARRNKRAVGQTTGGPPSTHYSGHYTHPDGVLFITVTTFLGIVPQFRAS